MGREIRRIPLDFDFPVGESYHDHFCRQLEEKGIDLETYDGPWWQSTLPKGEGWQLWQTVSDGPISPVFATPEELIEYMCQPTDPPGPNWRWNRPYEAYPSNPWNKGWRRDVAEKFVNGPGWAPSFVMTGDGRTMSGAELVTQDEK